MHSCFLKLFEIMMFSFHNNILISLSLELTGQFLQEGKISFRLIKIHLCEAKTIVMRVGSRTPATSKMEFFVTIVK